MHIMVTCVSRIEMHAADVKNVLWRVITMRLNIFMFPGPGSMCREKNFEIRVSDNDDGDS